MKVEISAIKYKLINFNDLIQKNDEMIKFLLELDNFMLDDVPEEYISNEIIKYIASNTEFGPKERVHCLKNSMVAFGFATKIDDNSENLKFSGTFHCKQGYYKDSENSNCYNITTCLSSVSHSKTKNRNYIAMIYIFIHIMRYYNCNYCWLYPTEKMEWIFQEQFFHTYFCNGICEKGLRYSSETYQKCESNFDMNKIMKFYYECRIEQIEKSQK